MGKSFKTGTSRGKGNTTEWNFSRFDAEINASESFPKACSKGKNPVCEPQTIESKCLDEKFVDISNSFFYICEPNIHQTLSSTLIPFGLCHIHRAASHCSLT